MNLIKTYEELTTELTETKKLLIEANTAADNWNAKWNQAQAQIERLTLECSGHKACADQMTGVVNQINKKFVIALHALEVIGSSGKESAAAAQDAISEIEALT